MPKEIPITLLLKSGCRTRVAANEAAIRAESLGLRVSSSGLASLVVRGDERTIQSLFHTTVSHTPEKAIGEHDFGSFPGFTAHPEPTVPDALKDYVERALLEPPAIRMMD